jgi:hypothetical protein
MDGSVGLVKVFSATRSKDRAALGERVTEWIRNHPEERILRTSVLLSSDRAFHCLSIVLICAPST